MPASTDYFSTHTVTARKPRICNFCCRSIEIKTTYVRVSSGNAGQHWTKAYHPDCHAELFPSDRSSVPEFHINDSPLPQMTFETAQKINGAAANIGLALVGATDSVDSEHIALIRSVTLAQMETAKEQIEAANRDHRDGRILLVCAEELLVNCKRYADSAKFQS